MKKLLLIAASTALISTSAFANDEPKFYVKADAGVAHFTGAKESLESKRRPVGSFSRKLKTNNSPLLSVSAGYYVADRIRAELELSHHLNAKLSKNGTVNLKTKIAGINPKFEGSSKHKLSISSIMLKGIVDIVDFNAFTIFAGAGVGVAKVSEKISVNGKSTLVSILPLNKSGKVKSKNNLAYTLIAGAAFEVAQGVKIEGSYNYLDYGKTKGYSNTDYTLGKTRLRAHVGKLGVRFDV